jgi:hypothetical protein
MHIEREEPGGEREIYRGTISQKKQVWGWYADGLTNKQIAGRNRPSIAESTARKWVGEFKRLSPKQLLDIYELKPPFLIIDKWKADNPDKIGELDELMKKPDKEEMHRRQKEHIQMIQQMAREAMDIVPLYYPNYEKEPEEFDAFNYAVVKAYRRLTGGEDWKNLAAHLGNEGDEIERLNTALDDLFPLADTRFNEYNNTLERAWILVRAGGIKTISESSDTRKWEYEGMRQRCPNCPDQHYEPVDADI